MNKKGAPPASKPATASKDPKTPTGATTTTSFKGVAANATATQQPIVTTMPSIPETPQNTLNKQATSKAALGSATPGGARGVTKLPGVPATPSNDPTNRSAVGAKNAQVTQ